MVIRSVETNKVEESCNEKRKEHQCELEICISEGRASVGLWFPNLPRGIKRSNGMSCKGFDMSIHTNLTLSRNEYNEMRVEQDNIRDSWPLYECRRPYFV
jgi:hypothetical protein